MARLHEVSEPESDEKFPDLVSLLQDVKLGNDASRKEKAHSTSPKRKLGSPKIPNNAKSAKALGNTHKPDARKQKPDHGDLFQLSHGLLPTVQLLPSKSVETKRSPRKTHRAVQAKEPSVRKFIKSGYRSYGESEASYESDTSLSGFIVRDSADEEESTPEKSAPRFPKALNLQNIKSTDEKLVTRDEDVPIIPPPKTPRRLITRRERDLLASTKTAKKTKDPKVVIDLVSPVKPTLAWLSSESETFENQKENVFSRSEPESLGGDDVSQQESSLMKDSSATDSSLLEKYVILLYSLDSQFSSPLQ